MGNKKYYVLSLNDWEDYQPHWFICECSKATFKKTVREAMSKAVSKLAVKKNDRYIDGYELLEKVVPLLQKEGFQLLKADYEFSFYGMCLYDKRKGKRRPTVIPSDAWKNILVHNEKIHKELYKRIEEDEEKREKKANSKCNS